MKKILFSVVCLMMVGIQSVKAQIGLAALHHEGKVTVFGEDKLADAITASVEGDTIYLSEGHFLGDITVDKPIHLIGSGQGTVIDGSITISIDNTPTLTGYMLIGMHINGNIIPTKSLNGLRIGQCYFGSYGQDRYALGTREGSIKITDLYIDRCQCADTFVLNEVESGNINSSKLTGVWLYGCTGRTTLNHCIMRWSNHYDGVGLGMYAINCIIGEQSYSSNIYQNCLFDSWSHDVVSTEENCWHLGSTDGSLFGDDLTFGMTDEELRTNGYLATDSTVVGITGGEAPFTLNLATPKVLEHNIVVDKDTKKLNVTLRVGNE